MGEFFFIIIKVVSITHIREWGADNVFLLAYGLARSNMALRDHICPCEIEYGLGRRPIALQVGPWLGKTVDGLARSNIALRDRIWPCEIKYGLARSNTALRDQIWP